MNQQAYADYVSSWEQVGSSKWELSYRPRGLAVNLIGVAWQQDQGTFHGKARIGSFGWLQPVTGPTLEEVQRALWKSIAAEVGYE
jgi:hypothetical protein